MPTVRTYDFILTVANASGFRNGNTVVGVTSDTQALIANVDSSTNQIKVKVDNVSREFSSGETLRDIGTVMATSANGLLNTSSLPFQANTFSSNTTVASTTISSITNYMKTGGISKKRPRKLRP